MTQHVSVVLTHMPGLMVAIRELLRMAPGITASSALLHAAKVEIGRTAQARELMLYRHDSHIAIGCAFPTDRDSRLSMDVQCTLFRDGKEAYTFSMRFFHNQLRSSFSGTHHEDSKALAGFNRSAGPIVRSRLLHCRGLSEPPKSRRK